MAKIALDDVSLTFDIRQSHKITLKEFVVQRMFRNAARQRMQVRALQNVSFAVEDGQRLGIIGHNGAGKSTLLRLLAGIYPPSSGQREVEGRISSLFDIALGFESEASGWENIGFRSYLQGETPKTIKDKIQPIAEFSELGDFLKMPVRYYSAGMSVRLAFSIATAIEPEILLVDEVLSVGDMAFQDKARRRMYEMMSKAKIIVMVSHDLSSIKKICNRVIWMEHGTVREIGPPASVIAAYTRSVQGEARQAA